ncbi:MAG: glycosyltransferase family protein [Catalinimonas sp.]
MKILYAIQGTGNGHLSRARDVVPLLMERGEVDLLVSGTQADVRLPYPVKYQLHGLSFVFGKQGGIDFWQTYRRNRVARFVREIRRVPVREYDLVVNDFEPVSAWACWWRRQPCVGLSHQYAVLAQAAPKPRTRDYFGEFILKRYAPATAHYGFHFARFADNIFTPVIRQQVRALQPTDEGHYTVYLPAYDDATLVRKLSHFPGARWRVFSKHNRGAFTEGNVEVRPVDNEAFVSSMASGRGVLCGAGFETPAEALFLGKRLMVVPMKGQYEQQLNAAALAHLGVPVLKSLKKKHFFKIQTWLNDGQPVPVNFPDETRRIVHDLVEAHAGAERTPIFQPLIASS